MFTAATTAVSSEPTPASPPSAPAEPKNDDRRRDGYDDEDDRPLWRDDDEEYDLDYADIRRRRHRDDYAPHRGGTILAMGIIGLVGWLFCGALIVLGPIAWILGHVDLREIRAGRMDPSGYGLTLGGLICGVITTILMIAGIVLFGVFILAGVH